LIKNSQTPEMATFQNSFFAVWQWNRLVRDANANYLIINKPKLKYF